MRGFLFLWLQVFPIAIGMFPLVEKKSLIISVLRLNSMIFIENLQTAYKTAHKDLGVKNYALNNIYSMS
jgi:hypothetical protein